MSKPLKICVSSAIEKLVWIKWTKTMEGEQPAIFAKTYIVVSNTFLIKPSMVVTNVDICVATA